MSNTDKKDQALQPEPPAEEILDDLESINLSGIGFSIYDGPDPTGNGR